MDDLHFPFPTGSPIIRHLPARECRMIHVAYARHFEAQRVVRLCAGQIAGVRPTLLVVFCGGKHPPEEVLAALRSVWPDTPAVGG